MSFGKKNKQKDPGTSMTGFDKTNVATFLKYGAQLSTDTLNNAIAAPEKATRVIYNSQGIQELSTEQKAKNAETIASFSDKTDEEMETLLTAFQSREETIKRRKKQPGRSQLLFAGR